MSAFQAREVLPGVWHIQDALGVCMTLLAGSRRALLVDAGYGFDDVCAFAKTLTDKPVQLLLTHAHHDHALGARWFPQALLFAEDHPYYARYTAEAQRRAVIEQARARGIEPPQDYLSAPMAPLVALSEGPIELGGLTAVVRQVPGHTPGSAVIEVPESGLLLTGDDWNPCTWDFFEECMPPRVFRDNMRAILRLPFTHVLCSHSHELFERAPIDAFFEALTDESLASAPAVEMGRPFRTHQLSLPMGQVLVFDYDKLS